MILYVFISDFHVLIQKHIPQKYFVRGLKLSAVLELRHFWFFYNIQGSANNLYSKNFFIPFWLVHLAGALIDWYLADIFGIVNFIRICDSYFLIIIYLITQMLLIILVIVSRMIILGVIYVYGIISIYLILFLVLLICSRRKVFDNWKNIYSREYFESLVLTMC